jgi:hypothetical protein
MDRPMKRARLCVVWSDYLCREVIRDDLRNITNLLARNGRPNHRLRIPVNVISHSG